MCNTGPKGQNGREVPYHLPFSIWIKLDFCFDVAFRAIVKTPDPLDGSDPDALSDKLVGFVHKLYFEHLLVNPKDRRIVLLDAVIGDLRVRDALVKGK